MQKFIISSQFRDMIVFGFLWRCLLHIDEKKKKWLCSLLLFIVITAVIFFLVKNDYGLYQATIGKVTAVEDTHVKKREQALTEPMNMRKSITSRRLRPS